ncbi:hypothetical protein BOG92_049955 [Streptomyces sp. WAC00263]|nr:hypothetical protein BOG92_049955 [Streptomyces sp. WAC00263]
MRDVKISELDRARLKKWAGQRIPEHAKAEVAVGCAVRGSTAVITEERAPWDGVGQWTSRRVARLRRTDEGWQVDGADRNGRWYPCDHLPAVPSLDEALTVLDDPRHAFWG